MGCNIFFRSSSDTFLWRFKNLLSIYYISTQKYLCKSCTHQSTCEIFIFFHDQNGSGKRKVWGNQLNEEQVSFHNRNHPRFNLEDINSNTISIKLTKTWKIHNFLPFDPFSKKNIGPESWDQKDYEYANGTGKFELNFRGTSIGLSVNFADD